MSARELTQVRPSAEGRAVYLGDRRIGKPVPTYADVPAGEALALIGSTDMLEIAVNSGHAARVLDAAVGTPVAVR